MQRRIVVLPDPLRPSSATRSPADSERSKLSTTRRVPYSRQSPSTTRTRSDPDASSRARAAPGSADRMLDRCHITPDLSRGRDVSRLGPSSSRMTGAAPSGGCPRFEAPQLSFGRGRHAAYPCPQQDCLRHTRKSTTRPGGAWKCFDGSSTSSRSTPSRPGISSGPSGALFPSECGIASSPTASSARWRSAGEDGSGTIRRVDELLLQRHPQRRRGALLRRRLCVHVSDRIAVRRQRRRTSARGLHIPWRPGEPRLSRIRSARPLAEVVDRAGDEHLPERRDRLYPK